MLRMRSEIMTPPPHPPPPQKSSQSKNVEKAVATKICSMFPFIAGFPGDKPSNSLWTTKCHPLFVTRGLIWNQCDVAQGSSGSGVFATDTSSGLPRTTVVGILSGEKTITSSNRQLKLRLNVAVHLTRSRVSQIKKWTQN